MSIFKKLRETQKVSQQAVAVAMGLSLTAYRNKENGRSKFYFDEVPQFCEAIGVNLADVVNQIFLSK